MRFKKTNIKKLVPKLPRYPSEILRDTGISILHADNIDTVKLKHIINVLLGDYINTIKYEGVDDPVMPKFYLFNVNHGNTIKVSTHIKVPLHSILNDTLIC